MNFISIILIAIALAMDAFSVSISCGLILKKPKLAHYLRLAIAFGGFQFIMPIIGYFFANMAAQFVTQYSHYIAFFLLLFIGAKMIYDSTKKDKEYHDPSQGRTLIMLAIATSIDALAVGFSLGALGSPILVPSLIIGLVCALFTIIGVAIGNKVSSYLSKGGEIFGGVILILIGIKIFISGLK